jgi:hypothetical protein
MVDYLHCYSILCTEPSGAWDCCETVSPCRRRGRRGNSYPTVFRFYFAWWLKTVIILYSGLGNGEYGRRDPLHWPRGTPLSTEVFTTLLTSSGRSVGIVRWRTQATEFSFFVVGYYTQVPNSWLVMNCAILYWLAGFMCPKRLDNCPGYVMVLISRNMNRDEDLTMLMEVATESYNCH